VALIFAGRPNEATAAIEEALTLAQHHELTEQLARSLNFKGIILRHTGRATEARALYELGLGIARDNGLVGGEMSIEANLSDLCMSLDLPGAEEHAVISLALCRRSGRRANEALAAANLMYILIMAGRFGETRQLGAELLQSDENERPGSKYIVSRLALLEAMQGNVAAARGYLAACAGWKHADDVQDRTGYAAAAAAVSLAAGDARQALDTGNEVIEEVMSGAIGVAHESTRLAFPVALTAAVEVGDLERADELLELMASRATGEVPPFLRGQVRRGRALVALARDEDDNVEANFIAAETTFRELGYRYWTALLQLERAEWLGRTERLEESASLGRDAATTLETLDVPPLLARTQALSRPPAVVASTTLAESS
jgi:tetratricopeptide (TPR) repeat protein